ncbi:MAG TPA: hypothetical protein PK629_04850 [Oscillospiraceae bacterium]|nr:hypothetical protein [Oscillospiraceae bacterium]HPK34875.1 hypothetical protein [Oscillospiraceae bacterium]HPR76161.1 hypothetical protein [Oscillospiraceae bacterium]
MVSADKIRVFRTGAWLLAFVVVLSGLYGCTPAAVPEQSMSTVSVSNTTSAVSDEVLDLAESPVSKETGGSVQMTGGEPVIGQFFARYADSMTTLQMYDYSDICADTVENAVITEFVRYRVALFRTQSKHWENYKMTVTELSRREKGKYTTIQVSAGVVYDGMHASLSDSLEDIWAFVIKKGENGAVITSVTITSAYYEDGQRLKAVQKALERTGLPLGTAKQVHTAGDEMIRYVYESGRALPVYLMAEDAYSIKDCRKKDLPYTNEYDLIYTTSEFDADTVVGLANRKKKMVFDLLFTGIGVTKNGYFVLHYGGSYIITGSDGYEIASYTDLYCYSKELTGDEVFYKACEYPYQPSAPYAASAGRGDEIKYWLLDENFQPVGESYDSLILTETGASATRDGTLYQLDKKGNVISKKEPTVTETFFGKYRVQMSYNSWKDGDVRYGLLDENGNVIYEQNYSHIEMPVENLVLLFTGDYQSVTGRAALLGYIDGNVFDRNYNSVAYLVTETGCIGIAQSFGWKSDVEINCRVAGCWLIDREGRQISEKYLQIGNAVDENGELYVNAADTISPLIFQSEDGVMKTVPLSEVLSEMVIKMGA